MLKEPLVKITNLSKSFVVEKSFFGKAKKTLRAVHSVNLDIFSGECLAIVGESGCGKSTLARLILRLLDSDTGEIKFAGLNFLELSSKELRQERKNMQMVFQNPFSSLDPRYKNFDSIAEPLLVHQKTLSSDAVKTRVHELLRLVDLDINIADKYPHECSGGQNQRVCIARALALNPKFLIADEAVSALDLSTQATVLELFKRLQKDLGLTILFITHNLGAAKHLADRIAVMYLGEIVEIASTKEIFENTLHPYTKALFASAPVTSPHLRKPDKTLVSGEIPKPTEIPAGCTFHTRCPLAKAECSNKIPRLEQKSSSPDKEHLVSCLLVD